MSQTTHNLLNNIAPCGVLEARFLPCSGVSGTTVSVFSCSSLGYQRIQSHVNIKGLNCSSRNGSFVCEARRNLQSFSSQSKYGFSRSRKWLNEERDRFESFEEDILSSKKGPSVSHSNTPKNHANAAPRPKEKEIIALLKKVQARLRERATIKEVTKVEASQEQFKENGSVDSLLKVLRKHSVEQGKRSSGISREKNSSLNPLQDGDQDNGSQSTSFSDLDGTPSNESQKINISFLPRPPSNFQRRSPVPRLKYQSVSYNDNNEKAVPLSNVIGEKNQDQIGMKPDPELDHDSEMELDPKDELFFPEVGIEDMSQVDSLDSEQIYKDEHGEDQQVEQHEDMSMLKLSELRAIAKFRGLKGFSKMKKGKLLELLTGS